MPLPIDYPFTRYLAAKKSVDDRALNKNVWDTLRNSSSNSTSKQPIRVLEVGAGIGTMIERMLERELLTHAHYTAIDAENENISFAHHRLNRWASEHAYQVTQSNKKLTLKRPGGQIEIELEAIDLFDFVAREAGHRSWDLLVAHAFLDLVDIPTTLPKMFSLLQKDGLYYFTLNFDGLTLLEPVIDPVLDTLIQDLYHQTMDARVINGKPAGDSRSGSHLFKHLMGSGTHILDAGASDWIIFPGQDGYQKDEAFFLHFIIHTIHNALSGHPELDHAQFEAWVSKRHSQVERAELVFIAHQLDFVGRYLGLTPHD
ncbi:MAG: methyltransferase [Anaerolineales bacterium]|nr:methyltransferase [Anaerolineales bacterium]